MINDEAIISLVKGIIKIASKMIDDANFNKGFTGRVFEIIDDNNYIVIINNKKFKVKSKHKLNINDVVKIVCLNNDMSELYAIY